MKSSQYWTLHSQIMKQKLNDLDNDIYDRIMADPYCKEAMDLSERVESLVEKELNKEY